MQNRDRNVGSSVTRDANERPFRPKLGGRVRAERSGASFRNAVLACAGVVRSAGGSRAKSVRARIAVRTPRPLSRRVVIKARVVRLGPQGAKAAALHLAYIERDGVEKDGSPGQLYAAEAQSSPGLASAFDQVRDGERHQFRLIISPEDAGELELTEYVRSLMRRMETDLGRPLDWVAVNHYDTDNPHAHVILRGVDREGQPLRIDRAYIANGLRWRAQELATEELGPRPEIALAKQQLREVTQERFTTLDRDIAQLAVERYVARATVLTAQKQNLRAQLLLGRLAHLERLGLATRDSGSGWVLVADWQERLRELGERGDIIKQMHRALRDDPARTQLLAAARPIPQAFEGPDGATFGRVVAKALRDELRGNFSAVVETVGGQSYHVPLDNRAAEAIREGDFVRLRVSAPDPKPTTMEAKPPKPRVFIDRQRDINAQIQHPGPVWLDEILRYRVAPNGFGAELHQAAARRQHALLELGVPSDGSPAAVRWRLGELERRVLAQRFAQKTAQAFVAAPEDGFQGHASVHKLDDFGRSHLVVSDGRRFVVIRAQRGMEGLHGAHVSIETVNGRLHVRPHKERER